MKLLLLYSRESVRNTLLKIFSPAEMESRSLTEETQFASETYDVILVGGEFGDIKDYLPSLTKHNLPVVTVSACLSETHMYSYLETGASAHISLPAGSNFVRSTIIDIIHSFSASKNQPLAIVDPASGKEIYTDISVLLNLLKYSMKSCNHHKQMLYRLLKENRGIDTAIKEKKPREEDTYSIRELETAIVAGEFQLYYQPVVDLQDNNRLVGFESLVRWIKPDGTVILPDEFISTIERDDLIFALSDSMVEQALQTLVEWNKLFQLELSIRINVNLSARLFDSVAIADSIIQKTERYGVNPGQLGLELTESAFMDSMEVANIILLKLKSYGFILYMDDFGTGYSSLSYLHHFPVHTLKVDKSFVKWLNIDEESEHIVRSIVGLAHGLGRNVVAEGVEEEEHVEFLREIGCEYGQGFYFAKPMSKEKAVDYIRVNLKL